MLIGVDREHLLSAAKDGLGRGERLVSFGTDFWTEDTRGNPESFPTDVPCLIYEVARGLGPSVPCATWMGRFVGYRRAESFAPGELDKTRPQSTIDRRRPNLADDEREPEWAGYLMVTDLRRLGESEWKPLRELTVKGRAFKGTVVRHPLLVGYQP